jgi:gluconolactonase
MQITRRNMLGAGAAAAAAASFAPEALAGWEPSESYPDPAIKILDPSFAKYRVNNAGVERLATGMRWSEGPVWMGDARCLLWSDIPNNRIMRWDEETGRVSIYRKPSNNANGNTRDRQGRLVTCEHSGRRVTRTEYDGSITVLIDKFDGKPLNSPNDVVVKSDDSVWFSDPPAGIRGNYEGVKAEAQLATNYYRLDVRTGKCTVVAEGLGANGLAFSPDEKKIYLVDNLPTPRVIQVATWWTTAPSSPISASSSPASRAPTGTASAAMSTAICGAAGAPGPTSTALRCSIRTASGSAPSRCRSAPPMSASAGCIATACSWRRAIRSIRST